MLAVVSLLALGISPPLWCQPTAVGIIWGSMFCAAFVLGGVGRGRLTIALAAFLLLALSSQAMQRTTDVSLLDSLLLQSIIFTGGWLSAMLDPKCRARDFRPILRQFSILDVVVLTSLFACFFHAVPRISTHPLLLVGVLCTLAFGVAISWVATRWGLYDHWNLALVFYTAVPISLALVGLHLSGTLDLTRAESLLWLMMGPINVVAAQATVVLLAMATMRPIMAELRREAL